VLGHGDAEPVGRRIHGRRQAGRPATDDDDVVLAGPGRVPNPERFGEFLQGWPDEDELVVHDDDRQLGARGAV
jgi:hypothetical protein